MLTAATQRTVVYASLVLIQLIWGMPARPAEDDAALAYQWCMPQV